MQSGDPGSRWIFTMIAGVVLVAAVLLAGCTGTSPDAPPLPAPKTFSAGQVLQVIGNVTGVGVIPAGVPRGTIDTITFTISLVPGATAVNLDNLTVIYADALHTMTLSPFPGFMGEPPGGSWGITAINKQFGPPNHRLDFDKQAVITINPKVAIVPGQVVTIAVKPLEGPAVTLRILSPSTIVQGVNAFTPL